ncbi:MAG: hypothetical protein LBT08_05150, partial [Synergistaceae bacterium]|jgi:HPt (histidine-containing phosphotransfer) domain-containing protein|nr:hypothetical protein [Synergistaceae bacterium]
MEAARIIRNDIGTEYARSVPIMALTANAIDGTREMFLANGFNAFISKPIDIMQLDMALNRWVRDTQSTETLMMAEREKDDRQMPQAEDLPQETGFLARWRIGEIDIEAGMQRYGGEEAYLKILGSYAKHAPDLLRKMEGVTEESLHLYAVTVHGLKGSSYGICADRLAKEAEALELAAKAGDFENMGVANDRFIAEVGKLVREIDGLLEEYKGNATEKPSLPSPDETLLCRVLSATKRFDWSAMDESLCELERYEYESGSDLVEWLREQTDNLEYGAIEERLRTICGA